MITGGGGLKDDEDQGHGSKWGLDTGVTVIREPMGRRQPPPRTQRSAKKKLVLNKDYCKTRVRVMIQVKIGVNGTPQWKWSKILKFYNKKLRARIRGGSGSAKKKIPNVRVA